MAPAVIIFGEISSSALPPDRPSDVFMKCVWRVGCFPFRGEKKLKKGLGQLYTTHDTAYLHRTIHTTRKLASRGYVHNKSLCGGWVLAPACSEDKTFVRVTY